MANRKENQSSWIKNNGHRKHWKNFTAENSETAEKTRNWELKNH